MCAALLPQLVPCGASFAWVKSCPSGSSRLSPRRFLAGTTYNLLSTQMVLAYSTSLSLRSRNPKVTMSAFAANLMARIQLWHLLPTSMSTTPLPMFPSSLSALLMVGSASPKRNFSSAAMPSGSILAFRPQLATPFVLVARQNSFFLVFPLMLSSPWVVGLLMLSSAIGAPSSSSPLYMWRTYPLQLPHRPCTSSPSVSLAFRWLGWCCHSLSSPSHRGFAYLRFGPEFPVPALGTPPVSRMEGPRPCPGCAQPT